MITRTLHSLPVLLMAGVASAQSSTNVGFDGGSSGDFIGNFVFEASGGNPDGNAHLPSTVFFPSLRTGGIGEPLNPSFIGDYSAFPSVTMSFDVKVDRLESLFIGNPLIRPIGIMLVDRDIQGPNGPSGVFFEVGQLSSAAQSSWTTLSVTIADTAATALPAGWIGFGDDDPTTFEPILPAGATFATVLAGVDEFRITGAVPGFFFSDAIFDMRIDNVSIEFGGGLGAPYCSANANSTGAIGVTGATGSAVAADNDVQLDVTGLPVGVSGIFIVSDLQASVPLAEGVLCLGGSIGRYQAPGQIFMTDAAGAATLAIDLNAIPRPNTTVIALAGETWNFQAWHRDFTAAGAPTSNLALPVSVTFQ